MIMIVQNAPNFMSAKSKLPSSFHHNNSDRIMKARPKHEALVLLVSDSNNMTSPELGFAVPSLNDFEICVA